MGRGSWGFGAFCLVAATAGSAAAQVAPPPMGAATNGPPAPRSLQLGAQLMVEHDTNIARAGSGIAAITNITPEDTVYAPTVSLAFTMPIGRQSVFFTGSDSYLFHEKNTRLNNDRLNLGGGAVFRAGPCGATLRGGYTRGRNELDNTSLLATSVVPGGPTPLTPTTSNLESTVLNIETVEDAGVNVSCSRPSGLGVFGQADQQWTSNSEVLSGSGSYRTTSYSLGVSYQRPQLGSLALNGFYARTIYGDQLAIMLTPRGSEVSGANLSFSRRLGGRIEANVSVGYTHAHTLDPPVLTPPVDAFKDFSGVTYSGGVTFRATSRLHMAATFQRQVTPTLLAGGSFEILTGYGADVEYSLGTRITLGLRADRQQSETTGTVPLTLVALPLTDSRVNDLSASATYRMNKRLSVSLTGSRETRKANDSDFNYTNDRVALTLSSTF